MIDPNALPPRQDGYAPAPCTTQFTKVPVTNQAGVASTLWALTIDTPDSRSVTFWTPEALERLLRRGLDALGVLPDGLVLATPDDMKGLH